MIFSLYHFRSLVLLSLFLTVFTPLLYAAPQAPAPGETQVKPQLAPVPEVKSLLDTGDTARKAKPPRLDEAEKQYNAALTEARRRQDAKGEIEALRFLGLVYADQNQAAKALDYYQQSLKLALAKSDKSGQALAYFDAAILVSDTQPGQATVLCRQALSLFREVGDKKREADTQTIMGRSLAATGQFAEAEKTYNQALSLYETLGDELSQANVLLFMGTLFSFDQIAGQGRPTAATATGYFERAIPLYHKLNNTDMEARLHTFVAGNFFYAGHLEEARGRFEKALNLFRAANNWEETADTLKQISTLYSLQDRLVESLQYDQEALESYRKGGDKYRSQQAVQLLHIGDLYTRFGQQKTALQNYLQALTLLEKTGDEYNQITALNSIGEVYEILGDRVEARKYLRRAIPLLEKPGSAIVKQRNQGVLASIYFQTGEYAKAKEVLEQQLTYLQNTGFTTSIPTTVSMLGLVERQLKHPDKALERYQQELKLLENSGDSLSKASTLESIAEIEEEQGHLEDAEQHLRESVAILEKTRAALGGLSQAKSTFLTANFSTYQRYLALLLRRNKPKEAFTLAQQMKARALLDILYEGKVQVANSLTPDERQQEKMLRQKADVLNYQLVKEGVQNEIGSKKRAESLKLQLVQAEQELQVFEDSLYVRHPDLEQKRAAHTITLEEAGKFLPADTALLEYVVLKSGALDKIALFVVTMQAGMPTLAVYTLPVQQKELTAQIEALRTACIDPCKPYLAPSQALYKTLIAPAEAQITGKKRLLICPDAILWDTPFAALTSPPAPLRFREGNKAGGQFLAERFEIAYAYSATGAQASLTPQNRGGHREPFGTILTFANPKFGDEQRFGDYPDLPGERPIGAPSRPIGAPSRPIGAPSRPIGAPSRPIGAPSRPIGAPSRPIGAPSRPIGAPSRDLFLPRGGYLVELPGTQQEANAIQSDFKDAVIYTGSKAQEAVAKREAGQYRYLHFATHGFFNDAAPLLSSIVLALPDKESGEDGFLTAREIFDLNLSAEMVVLSACNTARGEKRNGEGVVGLTWALFVAGAPTQVVSQWSVNDESTATLMKTFYANLTRKRMAKGEALRQAALTLMRGSNQKSKIKNQKWSHPYYWAPFILMGDWRK